MAAQQIRCRWCVNTQNEVILDWQKPPRRASFDCPIEIGSCVFRNCHPIVEFGGPSCELCVSDNRAPRSKRRDTQLVLIFAVDKIQIHPGVKLTGVEVVRVYLGKFAACGAVTINKSCGKLNSIIWNVLHPNTHRRVFENQTRLWQKLRTDCG